RKVEADEFYAELAPSSLTAEHKAIQPQALSGMLWSKQFYYYIIEQWLVGDPANPPPPASRWNGRNAEWRHLYNERVMSMPDAWGGSGKDGKGREIFEVGCFGLGKFGVCAGSACFSDGTRLGLSGGTSWMGMVAINLMRVAIELAMGDHVYEIVATGFLDHGL